MSHELERRWLSLASALGVLGGAVLVLSHMFFTQGKFLLLPYAGIVIGTLLAIRAERLRLFRHRFAAGFVAFMLASIALYVQVLVSLPGPSPDVLGHAWRLGFVALVGAAVNLAVARLSFSPSADFGSRTSSPVPG